MKPQAALQPHVVEVHDALAQYAARGLRLFSTSSFQTHSIPLLHILSTSGFDIPIYFLHTGFHFPETLAFRDAIAQRLGLRLINISSPVSKINQKDVQGKFLYTSDPDRCCYLNKILPLEPVLQSHDVWINGVRREQTGFRENLRVEESGAFETLRYHPILDWTSKMIWEYRKAYDLPEHPLDAKGYLSIGCVPCTRKYDPEAGARSGRWTGMTKEECGIHTEFAGPQ
jgi:phosphoadenosine phosphosulfate reductase